MKLRDVLNEILHESNLNDNFKKWFGKSKVTNGSEPIVCYHTTDHEFDAFSTKKIGTNHWQSKSNAHGGGFFFTDKKQYARGGKYTKEVYLKIENPLETTAMDYWAAADKFDMNSSWFFQTAKEENRDGIIIKSPLGSLYVVFKPNQIKSVKNDGSWSSSDNINS